MKTLTRIYHPYWKWEENNFNMWGKVANEKQTTKECLLLMKNTELFGEFMLKVVNEWKYSCEHNLSNTEQNRIAWLGQAACALALKCPETVTRKTWWLLSETEKSEANKKAEQFINYWENI